MSKYGNLPRTINKPMEIPMKEAIRAVRALGIMAIGHYSDKELEHIFIVAAPFLCSAIRTEYSLLLAENARLFSEHQIAVRLLKEHMQSTHNKNTYNKNTHNRNTHNRSRNEQ